MAPLRSSGLVGGVVLLPGMFLAYHLLTKPYTAKNEVSGVVGCAAGIVRRNGAESFGDQCSANHMATSHDWHGDIC